ncbi:single-stranded DNA-binding protein [Pimelobacter simplex]|uniref:Single-stranded DNA-binding protein n=1 Tax=Nocardioides simplex TaxID=2045 RepID=A0A0A1DMG2_NOCSI|nr:single-stranded DNA-binding protein [Pimelobacter simplex]AIY17758.1 Single-stranded DNA-binding protein [Pimelobacter simplex]MCG8150222.1 single-stranded DNA-binding protein [Pimelobacter simplex]GEB13568.1 single-stranded DNA-binding protein [Pimelobacter simplex]SFM71627.1 single-strand binding protein [Pimelobacter simplex]
MLPTITIDGRLVADPELRFTPAGKPVCSMRVAANDSRRLDDGSYENLEQIFVNVSLWEQAAEPAAEAFRRGDRVLVTGRIYQREYETRDGGKGTSLEIKFPTIAKVPAAARPAQGAQQRTAATSTNAGWDTPPATDEPPF